MHVAVRWAGRGSLLLVTVLDRTNIREIRCSLVEALDEVEAMTHGAIH